ncbi:MAG: hypothetical protein HYZ58_11235 [Acidobacteria bacterium]|nr:hypothetical protein [Acidobacteriota bacterium]
MRFLLRATAGAIAGALAGPAWLVLAYALGPYITLEMDRSVGAVASGFHEEERAGEETFAWTGSEVSLDLPGLDRRGTWSCTIRLRGARPDPATLPVVSVAIDGVTVAVRQTTNAYQDLTIEIPPRPVRPGAVVTLTSSNTFRPGPSDPRVLGVMVDRWACAPAGGVPVPPRQALKAAAAAAAIFGAAGALIGLTPGMVAVATGLLAAGQAIPIARGFGLFTPYVSRVPWLAFWIAAALVVAVRIAEWRLNERFRNTARFAAVFTAAALYLKLLALLHPTKLVIDAVFHAHRLERVLAGQLYFTQPMPGGVQFPYAIGLYLVAAPWSLLTSDHVTLLRVLVCATEVIAGALLYVMIVRTWGDRLMGAVAVALFNFVPLSYWVAGNANLTNAFGTSVALITVVAATTWPLRSSDRGQLAGLILLSSIALLSHVSTFALLLTTLVAFAFFCRWLGDPSLRAPVRAVFVATTIAVVVSTVSYYGHFGDVYRGLARLRAQTTQESVPAESPQAEGSKTVAGQPSARGRAATPLPVRTVNAIALSAAAVGWPILLLALVGAWRLWTDRARDRLVFLLAGWGVTYLAFLAASTVSPVDMPYQRYAAEFVGRVVYATYAAVVVLAARGGVWGWRAAGALRVATVALFIAAAGVGIKSWLDWLS